MKIDWVVILLLNLSLLKFTSAKGIFSKVGASCLYVAANFTSFPFSCDMPDLSFNCRCQNSAFLGTVTNCIDKYATDPHDLSKGYTQLVDICKAQGGKSWEIVDLVKLSQNATQYLIDYNKIPKPMYKASLVWKAKKIHDVQLRNKDIMNYQTELRQQEGEPKIFDTNSINGNKIGYNPYDIDDKDIPVHNKDIGMLKNGRVVGLAKLNSADNDIIKDISNINEIKEIGVENIINTPGFLLYHPVNIPDDVFNISYKSVSKLMDKRNLATNYGHYIYIYWALVMGVATLVNIFKWTLPYYNNRLAKTRLVFWCKKKIVCPQIIKPSNVLQFRSKIEASRTIDELVDGSMGMFIGDERVKSQEIQSRLLSANLLDKDNQDKLLDISCTLNKLQKENEKMNKKSKFYKNFKNNILHSIYTMPVRVHALIIIGYLVLNIVFCCVNYETVYPNAVFTCLRGQKLVSIADRTGIIGTVQLPLIFLFSSRNNFLIWITGLSYRSFQMFHKWTSRIVFVLLLLHCAFYLTFVNVRGDYIQRWGLLKWRCANTAFSAISLTFLISFFRRYIYEWFKATHKILLIIFSVGSWYHCLTLGWTEYLIAAYCVWGFEYLIRLGKVISSGGVLKGQCKVIFDTSTKEAHSIQIITNHSGWWKPYPGCYCWLRILRPNLFWQSHPFTVVSTTSERNYNQLVFIIRVKNGLTKKLANFIAKSPNGECNINMLAEGPYGNNTPFKQYDQSVLVAGGVGMAVIHSLAIDLAQIYRAQQLRGKKRKVSEAENRYISLIWLIPNFESLMAFKNEIHSLTEYEDVIEVQIFITRELKDKSLQDIVNKNNLVNPLNALSTSYSKGGFNAFASALVKSANLSNIVLNTDCENLSSYTGINTSPGTISNINSSIFRNNGLNIDFSTDFQLDIEGTDVDSSGINTNRRNYMIASGTVSSKSKGEGECDVNKISGTELNNGNSSDNLSSNQEEEEKDEEKTADLEMSENVINNQREEEIKFLNWLIEFNGQQISINFEDKPFLQDELTNYLETICGDGRPTALIACGPTTMNADVRFSALQCLKKKIVVDYYEEELLW